MSFQNLSNTQKSNHYKKNYNNWKDNTRTTKKGFFIIYNDFLKKDMLRKISGNALKLYIYLGLHSQNNTGEVWHTIDTIAKYFNKSPRTISYWIHELESIGLIIRMQLKLNEESHTYLQPY